LALVPEWKTNVLLSNHTTKPFLTNPLLTAEEG